MFYTVFLYRGKWTEVNTQGIMELVFLVSEGRCVESQNGKCGGLHRRLGG